MNIAIVDDMAAECETLRTLLKQYAAERRHPLQIREFHSGEELLRGYILNTYDAIFLDIFINDENGVDCARKLRQLDENVNLIFLTTSPDFGVKSYEVRAADYIVKPASPDKLERALRYCRIDELTDKPAVTVTTRQQPLKIELDRILYADFQDRTVCIHLTDCMIPVSGSFTELSGQLAAYPQFMSCFKGILVNLLEVQDIPGDCLVLKNGERLPVSRRLQRQVQQHRLRLSAGSLRGGWK